MMGWKRRVDGGRFRVPANRSWRRSPASELRRGRVHARGRRRAIGGHVLECTTDVTS